jgi:hypothetical protein
MSKSALKKFKKNDYSDHEEYHDDPRDRVNKRKEKRVERALRTKDISALVEDDEDFDIGDICSGTTRGHAWEDD